MSSHSKVRPSHQSQYTHIVYRRKPRTDVSSRDEKHEIIRVRWALLLDARSQVPANSVVYFRITDLYSKAGDSIKIHNYYRADERITAAEKMLADYHRVAPKVRDIESLSVVINPTRVAAFRQICEQAAICLKQSNLAEAEAAVDQAEKMARSNTHVMRRGWLLQYQHQPSVDVDAGLKNSVN